MSGGATRQRCDVCGTAGDRWLQKQGRTLFKCSGCGYAWVPEGLARTVSGQSIYEDDARALFDDFADYYQDPTAVEAAAAKLTWVERFVTPGARLLDVGANLGQFVSCASARGYAAAGIELSPAAVRLAQVTLGDAVKVGSIYDDDLPFSSSSDGRFDAITMFDVIEHLPDPERALRRAHALLSPGGRLFLTTPDLASPYARLMGAHWHHLDLEQHISLFGVATLTRLLTGAGFALLDRRTVGRIYRASYVQRRVGDLASHSVAFRALQVALLPLRALPGVGIPINLGDVMGLAAVRT